MKKIENKLRQFTVEDEEWWKLMCQELTAYFGTSCYWIPWKVPEASRDRLERAYQIAQKNNDKTLAHFLQNVKKG